VNPYNTGEITAAMQAMLIQDAHLSAWSCRASQFGRLGVSLSLAFPDHNQHHKQSEINRTHESAEFSEQK